MTRRLSGLLTALWLGATSSIFGVAAVSAEEPYSDAKLESFATALLAVNGVVERWRPQMQSAESDDHARAMVQEAEAEMRSAVDQTDGITVEEYGTIIRAAQADPALMSQIERIVAERLAKPQ